MIDAHQKLPQILIKKNKTHFKRETNRNKYKSPEQEQTPQPTQPPRKPPPARLQLASQVFHMKLGLAWPTRRSQTALASVNSLAYG